MNNRTTMNDAGKIPPQAVEVEQAVLGALMLERNAYNSVSDILTVESFYDYKHQIIFKVIQDLARKNRPIDLLVVTRELKDQGRMEDIGGVFYITQLTSMVASAANTAFHARIIAQKHIARELIRITSQRCSQAFDESEEIEETLTGLQNDLITLLEAGKGAESSMADGCVSIKERIAFNKQKKGLSGIGTGLFKLDNFTGGLQKTDLVIIAGDSSHGKTSFALTILKNSVMKYGARAAVYSLEMSRDQLISRILATECSIPAKDILGKCLSDSEANKIEPSLEKLNKLPIFFDETSTSNIDQICASIRRLKIKKNINLVIVDYLQMVDSGLKINKDSDETAIAKIARKLKNIAKELNITVIALSQFNRDKYNPRPTVGRLRGSGQIVEAADLVLLLWRPEQYEIMQFPKPHEGISSAGLAECMIAKGRNVGTGSFLLRFDAETTGFYDYAPEYSNAPNSYNPNQRTEQANDNPF